jgi:hypothetical protein
MAEAVSKREQLRGERRRQILVAAKGSSGGRA